MLLHHSVILTIPLAEVSKRGVVLIDFRESDAPPRNPLFCPWGKVRFLELEAGQEQAPE